MSSQLIYVHDPMCSWCWGFTDTYLQLVEQLPANVEIVRLLGGLAPDTDEIMPESTRLMVQQNWHRIEQLIPGIQFNYDFWTKCQPRRATYPACRAVIAAREQDAQYDLLMTRKIQKAYYQEARNTSENNSLIELADELGLDRDRFAEALNAEQIQQQLLNEIASARSIDVNSFPSLMLQHMGKMEPVLINYTDVTTMLDQINESLGSTE
ncbi:MAG: DsbA family protein [Gammaproteobacteria bacterium]|nr:DsbA family protein [Gammaproteobacteria bacterium]